jgi:hypothetical protein
MHPAIVYANTFLASKYRVIGFEDQVFQRYYVKVLARHKISLELSEVAAF